MILRILVVFILTACSFTMAAQISEFSLHVDYDGEDLDYYDTTLTNFTLPGLVYRNCSFDSVRFKGRARFFGTSSDSLELRFTEVYADTLQFERWGLDVNFYDSRINFFRVGQPEFDKENIVIPDIVLFGDTINKLVIHRANVDHIMFDETQVNTLSLANLTLNHSDFIPPVDTLILAKISFHDETDRLYLGHVYGEEDATDDQECLLYMSDMDLSKVSLDYSKFRLWFPKTFRYGEKNAHYKKLLTWFQEKNLIDYYEKLDREYREFKYLNSGQPLGALINWIDKNWWDYGYNKILVVRNAIVLNVIFFLINLFLFKKLVTNGYRIDKFFDINSKFNSTYHDNKTKRFIMKAPYIFLYTSTPT
jgi:hypothetical protein